MAAFEDILIEAEAKMNGHTWIRGPEPTVFLGPVDAVDADGPVVIIYHSNTGVQESITAGNTSENKKGLVIKGCVPYLTANTATERASALNISKLATEILDVVKKFRRLGGVTEVRSLGIAWATENISGPSAEKYLSVAFPFSLLDYETPG